MQETLSDPLSAGEMPTNVSLHYMHGPIEKFLSRPAPIKRSEASVAHTVQGVRILAASGAWCSAAALSETLLGNSHPVDVLLTLRWYRIVALIKMRDVPKAEHEMAMLGDLHSQGWYYERYAGIYPNRAGSMVHASVLVLQALLPSYKGNHDDALAQLYALVANGDRDPLAERALSILAIVNVLCAVHDHANAVGHVEQLIAAVEREGESAPKLAYRFDADTARGTHDAAVAVGSGMVSSPDLPQLFSLLGRLHLQVVCACCALPSSCY